MSNLKLGWLSPTGELIECHSYEHIAVAEKIAQHLKLNTMAHRAIDDCLIANQWVHIGVSSLGQKEWRIWWGNHLTPEQKMFLEPYFEDERPMAFGSRCKWDREIDNI